MTTAPPDPRGPRGRGRRLVVPLRRLTHLLVAAALAALVVPGEAAQWIAHGAIGALVAAPFARVAFLGWRWWRIGDRRYAVAAWGVMLIGLTVALYALGAGRPVV